MKRLLLSIILVPSLALAADLHTLDGEYYKDFTVTGVDRYELKVTYESGIATVPLASLSDADLDRYSPHADRSKDGRFWYERTQALYQGWHRAGGGDAANLDPKALVALMQPMREHRDVITAYSRQLAVEQQLALATEKAEVAAARAKKYARITAQLQMQSLFWDDRPVSRTEQALRDALLMKYIDQEMAKP